MLDHDDGDALAADLVDQLDADLQFGRIETGEPFVEQQQLRPGRQRARQLDPLLIDVGQLRPVKIALPGKADPFEQRVGLAARRSRESLDRCRTCGRA